MAKPVKWTETWTGLAFWIVPQRPRPKWYLRELGGTLLDVSASDLVVYRDTRALRRTLKSDVRPESIKRVRVTLTVEELEA